MSDDQLVESSLDQLCKVKSKQNKRNYRVTRLPNNEGTSSDLFSSQDELMQDKGQVGRLKSPADVTSQGMTGNPK